MIRISILLTLSSLTFGACSADLFGGDSAQARYSPDNPADFDIKVHARRRPWEYPGSAPCDAVIRLADRLVPAIPEIFGPNASLKRTEDGPRVHLRVNNRAQLIATVLPYGAAAEVLTPADLRQEICEIYEQLARRYSPPRRRAPSTERARAQ